MRSHLTQMTSAARIAAPTGSAASGGGTAPGLHGGSQPPAATREKLLLVDDDTGVRLTLAALIGLCGYDVAAAASGEEALRLVASGERYIALVTDVHMPEMTGIELVTTLIGQGVDLPVLFLSGQADAPLPPEWPDSVPRRFLAKPFTPDVLNAALSRLFA